MDDSMPRSAAPDAGRLEVAELPPWKLRLGALAAWLVAIPFAVAGIWKLAEPFAAAERMTQALVPYQLSGFAAFAFGVSETLAAVFLVTPRFRRWGGWLTAVLLAAFIAYIGVHYRELTGEECNCFPWVQRAVGPWFFISDAIMLALAVAATAWSYPSRGLRSAAVVFGAIVVFAGVMYGVQTAQRSGIQAPETILVNGQSRPLRQGVVFLFFFDPECSHCFYAADDLAKEAWLSKQVYAVAIRQEKWAQDFLRDSHFEQAQLSFDAGKLRKVFSFTEAPYAVILQHGRQVYATNNFEDGKLKQQLKQYGLIR